MECIENNAFYINSIERTCTSLNYFSNLSNPYNVTQKKQDVRTTVEWDLLDYLNVSSFYILIKLNHLVILAYSTLKRDSRKD